MSSSIDRTKLIGLRARIDQLDRQLIECLAQREQCIEHLFPLKNTEAVLDTPREQVVVDSRSRWAEQEGLDRVFVATFFAKVMQHRAEMLQHLRADAHEPVESEAVPAPKPLVYSCSGCSNLAQLANQAALTLDRNGRAEMSCIAGVGGGVTPLVNKAKQADTILALDGCALHCVKHCLAQHDITPTHHVTLTELGLKKRQHRDFDSDELHLALDHIQSLMAQKKSAPKGANVDRKSKK